MRAYVQLAKLRLLEALTYRFDVFAGFLTNLILMFATVFLWETAFRGMGTVEGVNEGQMVTYAIIGALLATLTTTTVQQHLNMKIRRGDIAVDLIRPINPPVAWLAEDIGSAVARVVLQALPLLIFAIIFVRIPAPANLTSFLLFLPCCVLSFGILWLLSALSGLIVFWTMDLGDLGIVKDAVVRILAGGLVPLWFFPMWAQKISACLPFQYAVQLPLSIYIGKARVHEALQGIGIQLFWVAVLGVLTAIVWRRGRRKLLVQGG